MHRRIYRDVGLSQADIHFSIEPRVFIEKQNWKIF